MTHIMAHTMTYTNAYITTYYYRVCNGPIRLIFKLLIIYRVTEPTKPIDSKYYLLIGPYLDP